MNMPNPHLSNLAARIAAVAVAAVYSVCISACPVETIPVDPDAVVDDGGKTWDGPPYAELGFYFSDSYTAFATGDQLPVVNGLQGGTWTMPVIRMQNLGSFATIACDVTMTSDQEVVGFMSGKAKFFLSPEGFYEALNVPIPVYHAGTEAAPIDDLFGRMAMVACSVTDKDQRMAEFEIELELVEGVDPVAEL